MNKEIRYNKVTLGIESRNELAYFGFKLQRKRTVGCVAKTQFKVEVYLRHVYPKAAQFLLVNI